MLELLAEKSTDDDGRGSHDTEPAPCRGCPHFTRCARKLIACEAFGAFVNRDRAWSNASRSPIAETYRKLYG